MMPADGPSGGTAEDTPMSAAQADTVAELRRAVAELRQQRDAAAAQTAALGEVLRAIAASPDDPQLVFELIARRARELCGASSVAICEYDGTLLHLRMTDGHDAAADERWRRSYPRIPGPELVLWTCAAGEPNNSYPGLAGRTGIARGGTRPGRTIRVARAAAARWEGDRCHWAGPFRNRRLRRRSGRVGGVLRRTGVARHRRRGDATGVAGALRRTSGVAGIPGSDNRRAEGDVVLDKQHTARV